MTLCTVLVSHMKNKSLKTATKPVSQGSQVRGFSRFVDETLNHMTFAVECDIKHNAKISKKAKDKNVYKKKKKNMFHPLRGWVSRL